MIFRIEYQKASRKGAKTQRKINKDRICLTSIHAAESKQALLDLDTPYITNVGRKGGSNIAASVVNALAIMAQGS